MRKITLVLRYLTTTKLKGICSMQQVEGTNQDVAARWKIREL